MIHTWQCLIQVGIHIPVLFFPIFCLICQLGHYIQWPWRFKCVSVAVKVDDFKVKLAHSPHHWGSRRISFHVWQQYQLMLFLSPHLKITQQKNCRSLSQSRSLYHPSPGHGQLFQSYWGCAVGTSWLNWHCLRDKCQKWPEKESRQ